MDIPTLAPDGWPIDKPWTSYNIKYTVSYPAAYRIDHHGEGLATLIQEEKMETAAILEKVNTDITSDTLPQSILELMPGSTPEDWHRNINPSVAYKGGWVYKDSQIDKSSYVMADAVVYGHSNVGPNCNLFGGKIIDSQLTSGVSIRGTPFLSGAFIDYDTSIIDNAVIYGKVGRYCTIRNNTVISKTTVVTDSKTLYTTPIEYRTQKTRGLSALAQSGFTVPENSLYDIEWLKTDEELKALVGNFVRPCPVTPRHGFVDSRSIKDIGEARKLIEETKAADEKAEIISMPFIDASHSGVWTEGLLSIGKNHDGATSGRDSIQIPVIGYPEKHRNIDWEQIQKNAGITESPYIEILWKKREQQYNALDKIKNKIISKVSISFQPLYVQLRNGPKLPETIDFVPKQTVVKQIVIADGDLLVWEKQVKEFSEGTVVYHPGGSLASHYAVHAFLSNTPILISRKPVIGEILEPDTKESEPDVTAMKRGFMLGCKVNMSLINAAYIMMAGCHHTAKWLGKNDLLLGLAMGCTYRLIVSATLGEYRRHGAQVLQDGSSIGERTDEYETYFPRSFHGITRKRYIAAMKSFDKEAWPKTSIGGPKWFLLARWAGLIFNALVDNDYKSALEALNKGVNSVHNGGWTFNKFIYEAEMTRTAANPIHSILPIAPILYEAIERGGVGLEKRFISKRKFELEELDPNKYLEERNRRYQEEYGSKYKKAIIGSSVKVCCTKDCCGDPDCEDCHPAIVESDCDCQSHNCSDCYPDGCDCDCTGCHDCSDKCTNCCECGDHDCPNCYSDGCNCNCLECHDSGCSNCESEPELEEV